MKTNRHHITWTVIILLNLMFWGGCDDPAYYNRPTPQLCTEWLDGKQILVAKGMLLDDYWTIRQSEFKSFDITSITKDNTGLYTAQVKFDLADGAKKLRVYATMTYRAVVQEKAIVFGEFRADQVLKMGAW